MKGVVGSAEPTDNYRLTLQSVLASFMVNMEHFTANEQ